MNCQGKPSDVEQPLLKGAAKEGKLISTGKPGYFINPG
jgi:hypothetical protein